MYTIYKMSFDQESVQEWDGEIPENDSGNFLQKYGLSFSHVAKNE